MIRRTAENAVDAVEGAVGAAGAEAVGGGEVESKVAELFSSAFVCAAVDD